MRLKTYSRLDNSAPVGLRKGFYLVRSSDHQRFFISDHVDTFSLEKVAAAHLSEKTGWDYWIDKSLGMDVLGNVAWANLDFTDHFI